MPWQKRRRRGGARLASTWPLPGAQASIAGSGVRCPDARILLGSAIVVTAGLFLLD